MVADNGKISTRQLGRMVVLDWIGKAALLLPGLASGVSGRSFILSLVLGVGLSLAYGRLVGYLASGVRGDFPSYVEERLGRLCARLLMFLYFGYAFLNTVLLLRLFEEIALTCILPEASGELLMGVLVLGAVYIVSGGLEVRARVSEVLCFTALAPMALLLVGAAFTGGSGYLVPGQVELSPEMAGNGLRVFMVFGGMGIFLFVAPRLEERKEMGRTLMRAVAVTGLAAAALLLAAINAFGEAGMRAFPWPVITLMSSAEIPGGFLQRWDVIFTALLLGTFFAAVSAGLFYMRRLAGGLLGKDRPAAGPLMALFVYAGALWCASYETAARVYTVLGGYLCVPLLVGFTLLLAVVECAGRKNGKAGERRRI